jgi:hypothetical protein
VGAASRRRFCTALTYPGAGPEPCPAPLRTLASSRLVSERRTPVESLEDARWVNQPGSCAGDTDEAALRGLSRRIPSKQAGVGRPSNPSPCKAFGGCLRSSPLAPKRTVVGFERKGRGSLARVRVRSLRSTRALTLPGRGPRLALHPCERSLFGRVLGAGLQRIPPFESLSM